MGADASSRDCERAAWIFNTKQQREWEKERQREWGASFKIRFIHRFCQESQESNVTDPTHTLQHKQILKVKRQWFHFLLPHYFSYLFKSKWSRVRSYTHTHSQNQHNNWNIFNLIKPSTPGYASCYGSAPWLLGGVNHGALFDFCNRYESSIRPIKCLPV